MMSEDSRAWAEVLGLPPEQADRFQQLADELDMKPADIFTRIVERVIRFDRELGSYGLPSLKHWLSKKVIADFLLDDAVGGLPVDIRPTGFMWPADKPFPWTAEQCKAAIIGFEVKWLGDFHDFLHLLRGQWEMSDGYVSLLQH
jgi:hypothetical protein